MKNIIFLSLFLGLPLLANAQMPNGTGKVLVLENEKTLDGDIEKIGEQYRIRRPVGETWVPANQVLKLCASTEDAYHFVHDRSNLNDPDERMKLALWCHMHGLDAIALTEVQAAVALRPDHPASKRLLKNLQQQQQEAKAGSPAATAELQVETAPITNVELTGEALSRFTAKVQPILMNSCATCHATGRGGNFKLLHAHDSVNTKVTQYNLAAVLSQVNTQQPEASVFLMRALTLHGSMNQPPFRNRQSPPYRVLEDWVLLTMVNKPTSPTSSPQPVQPPTPVSPVTNAATVPVAVSHPAQSASPPKPGGPAGPAPSQPASKPESEDPYDGENFNRMNPPPEQPPKRER